MSVVADNPDLSILQGDTTPPEDNQDIQVDPEKAKADEATRREELKKWLKIVANKAEDEDLAIRYPLLARAKRNELYFNNIQKLIYDDVARDYRSIDDITRELGDLAGAGDIKTNNIYRAFAESLIAALSITPPAVEFTPDDAQDPEDMETAEAYTHTSELIARHNKSQLILIKTLTILFNQGVVAGYNFPKTDPAFGNIKSYTGTKAKQIPVVDIRCKQCAELLDSSIPAQQFKPDVPVACPTCDYVGPPQAYKVMEDIEEPQYQTSAKTRSLYDVFGMTAVKLPLYAKKQDDCGYLILRVDDHIAKFQSVYDPKDEIHIQPGSGDTERYERWARLPVTYVGSIPQHLTTARYCWLRPWYFYTIEDASKAKALVEEYPTGVMIALIGEEIVDISHEKLDDVWTVTFDPKANYIHAEPAGNAIIPLQDAENDLFNLGLQSIEYGIPETFANPKTVNFEAYSKSPSAPGMLTKAMPPGPDKTIADGFHTIKTATLSNEYSTFNDSLARKTQFTSGAFPSVFGGGMDESGGTATEYTESRARALQRLQLTWQMICAFWGDLTFKAVKLFIQNMSETEQFSKKEKGTFINVFISKASTTGNVGHIEPEVNGQLPQSWAQKKEFLMSLIQLNIPEIGSILLHPNNSEMLKLATGMTDIYIPGEKDTQKQHAEYYELSVGQPIGNQPSVPIDIYVDDHAVHMQILKNKLVSPEGIQLYKTNPSGYQNCIAHYIAHELANQAKTMEMSGNTAKGQPAETAAKSTQG